MDDSPAKDPVNSGIVSTLVETIFRLAVRPPGLTPKAVLETLAAIQMLDVWLPTTEGRWLVMPRYTQPETDQAILWKRNFRHRNAGFCWCIQARLQHLVDQSRSNNTAE